MRFNWVIVSCIILAGCTHHPMLSSSQNNQIDREDHYLKDHAALIYTAIREAKAQGAIIVMPANLAQKPTIIPGDSAITILVDNDLNLNSDSSGKSRTCYFVFSEQSATVPMRMPCISLVESAKIIRNMKSSYETFAGGLASAMYLVTFHSTQLEQFEKQFGTVSKALSANSSLQGQTNQLMKQTIEQIAKSYSDFNAQLSDIVKRIEAIK